SWWEPSSWWWTAAGSWWSWRAERWWSSWRPWWWSSPGERWSPEAGSSRPRERRRPPGRATGRGRGLAPGPFWPRPGAASVLDAGVVLPADHEPHRLHRFRAVVVEAVRLGRVEGDGVSGLQLVLLEPDLHGQRPREDVAVLPPVVPHQRLLRRGRAAHLVGG